MRKNYGESPEEATTRIVADYRRAATFTAPLRKTLEQFDNKVYNKRFLDALRANAGYERIYEDRRPELVYIYVYSETTNDQHTICCIQLKDCKRINTAESKKSAAEYYTKHLKKAAEIEECAPQMDMLQAQIKELEGLIKQVKRNIPYELRSIYNIGPVI